MKKFEKKQLIEAINKQFEINWYDVTFDDVSEWKQDTDELMWFRKYTTTEEKEEDFKKWLRKYLKPYTNWRLEKEVNWFILEYWLMIKT